MSISSCSELSQEIVKLRQHHRDVRCSGDGKQTASTAHPLPDTSGLTVLREEFGRSQNSDAVETLRHRSGSTAILPLEATVGRDAGFDLEVGTTQLRKTLRPRSPNRSEGAPPDSEPRQLSRISRPSNSRKRNCASPYLKAVSEAVLRPL
jgi:hypothetical protein